eukprot:794723-Prorocentrum_minimum.AAC.2
MKYRRWKIAEEGILLLRLLMTSPTLPKSLLLCGNLLKLFPGNASRSARQCVAAAGSLKTARPNQMQEAWVYSHDGPIRRARSLVFAHARSLVPGAPSPPPPRLASAEVARRVRDKCFQAHALALPPKGIFA